LPAARLNHKNIIFSSCSTDFRCVLAGAISFETEAIVPVTQPRAALGSWAVEFFPGRVCAHPPLPVAIHQGYTAGSCNPPAELVAA